MSRRKLIAGNWKMNGLKADGLALVDSLLASLGGKKAGFDMLVCPPATLIDRIGQRLAASHLWLGGQDCHEKSSGAFTGEVSADMLADAGARFVILGHSERRALYGETDALVRAKAEAALAAGLHAIICVGESEQQRLSGAALSVVASQVAGSLPQGAGAANVTIAYEPVWAIGTGRTPTAADVQEMHAHLRAELARHVGAEAGKLRILYGGSVKPSNAAELMTLPDVDGGLIGGASLKAEEFWAIALASTGGSA
jgi:triosephosphate isomerase